MDGPLHFAEHLHLACFHVTLDPCILSDGKRSLLRLDLTLDHAIDNHVILKLDCSGDLNSSSEDILGSGHQEQFASCLLRMQSRSS